MTLTPCPLTSVVSFAASVRVLAACSVSAVVAMFSIALYHAIVVVLLFISTNRLLPYFTLRGVTRIAVFKAGTRVLIVALILAPIVVDIAIVFSLEQVIFDAIASSASSIGVLATYSWVLFVNVLSETTSVIATKRTKRGSKYKGKRKKRSKDLHGGLL